MYSDIIKIIESGFFISKNFVTNSANLSSLIYNSLDNLNWVGFYMLKGENLELATFMGKPACERIKIGKGVCGTSAQKEETIIVPDVDKFPGHIVCDSASKSEIVVPLIKNGFLYGVMDIDSDILSRFDESDKSNLEQIAELLMINSDMENIKNYFEAHK